MHVVVTGNLGYLGPVVVEHLRRQHADWTLRGFDTLYFSQPESMGARPTASLLDGQTYEDIRNLTVRDLRGADAVVHLAAISNDPMGGVFEGATLEINHRATVHVARTALQAEVSKFIFASSCSVYGMVDGVAAHEQSPVQPLTAYARSKIAAEQDLQRVAIDGLAVSCLRFATACGMSPNLRLDLVLNDFVASAVATKTVRVLSNGSPWRPLIALSDMARAIEWAITRSIPVAQPHLVVNIGSEDWNFRIRDLASAVGRCLSETTVEINHLAPVDHRSYRVDFSLFKKLAPHHQPLQTLDGTIEDLRRGLLNLQFCDRNFRESNWIRLQVLKRLLHDGLLTNDLRWI